MTSRQSCERANPSAWPVAWTGVQRIARSEAARNAAGRSRIAFHDHTPWDAVGDRHPRKDVFWLLGWAPFRVQEVEVYRALRSLEHAPRAQLQVEVAWAETDVIQEGINQHLMDRVLQRQSEVGSATPKIGSCPS